MWTYFMLFIYKEVYICEAGLYLIGCKNLHNIVIVICIKYMSEVSYTDLIIIKFADVFL
jgi:hypothetical protein